MEYSDPQAAQLLKLKRVLECLQRSLRVAGNCFEEIIRLQLYCDALDQYLYYFERGVQEVS